MILLLGGTTETPKIANLLAKGNCRVLISSLNESMAAWNFGNDIRLRYGAIDVTGMCELVADEDITAIVDAGHPYAKQLHETAMQTCCRMNVPYYRYERPSANYNGYDIEFADDHQNGAELTFRIGHRALLTTGTRNLAPYVKAARKTNSKLYVRALPCEESITCCKKYAIDKNCIIAKHGPFTIQQNLETIKNNSIDVIVSKDSGIEGGVPEKLEAAKASGIKTVIIRKPVITQKTGESFEVISELTAKVISDI